MLINLTAKNHLTLDLTEMKLSFYLLQHRMLCSVSTDMIDMFYFFSICSRSLYWGGKFSEVWVTESYKLMETCKSQPCKSLVSNSFKEPFLCLSHLASKYTWSREDGALKGVIQGLLFKLT